MAPPKDTKRKLKDKVCIPKSRSIAQAAVMSVYIYIERERDREIEIEREPDIYKSICHIHT